MRTVLITGAAGDVGSHLRRELAGRFKLRVADVRPIADLAPGETFARADARRMEDMLQAHPDLGGVFGINDDSALGALSVIAAAGPVLVRPDEAAGRPDRGRRGRRG